MDSEIWYESHSLRSMRHLTDMYSHEEQDYGEHYTCKCFKLLNMYLNETRIIRTH
jgi:hypothetical protein